MTPYIIDTIPLSYRNKTNVSLKNYITMKTLMITLAMFFFMNVVKDKVSQPTSLHNE